MNIQMTNRLTAAETALIEAYNEQMGSLPGNGAVAGTRDRLLDDLKTSGLPTRRVESWHYTDLRTLLRAVPAANVVAPTIEPVASLVEGAQVLPVLQGAATPSVSVDGAEVSGFADALISGTATASLTARDKDDAIG